MSIFRSRREEEVDLSDDSLLTVEGNDAAVEVAEDAAADAVVMAAADEADSAGAEAQAMARQPEPSRAEQEQTWREAVTEASQSWPELMADPQRLIAKMAEISARYGDNKLWQRVPAGIMREAALELFGAPGNVDKGAISDALKRAHEEGRKQAWSRHQEKLGLAPPAGGNNLRPVVSEDEKIIREMIQAKRGGIF